MMDATISGISLLELFFSFYEAASESDKKTKPFELNRRASL